MGVKMLELNYKKLEVWKVSKEICLFVYKITKRFPKEEIYGITSQIRRCAVSIPSNIAEGYAKTSSKENLRFIEIAYGSFYELTTQMDISYDLEYINDVSYRTFILIAERLSKLLFGYKKSIQNRSTENGEPKTEN